MVSKSISPGYLVAKFDTNGRRSLAIVRDYAWLKLYCGYNYGDSAETIDTGYQINNGEWYHIGFSLDGVNRTVYIRIFRASNSAVTEYFKTFANQLHVEDATSPSAPGMTATVPIVMMACLTRW